MQRRFLVSLGKVCACVRAAGPLCGQGAALSLGGLKLTTPRDCVLAGSRWKGEAEGVPWQVLLVAATSYLVFVYGICLPGCLCLRPGGLALLLMGYLTSGCMAEEV